MSKTEIKVRLLKKTDKSESCWKWIGSTNKRGYGQIKINGKVCRAHRVSYGIFKGQIPYGYEIDHLCKNTSCINPDHLELVTHKENVLRGVSPAAFHSKQIKCDRGHEFTKQNTYFYDGGRRRCRICTLKRNKKSRERVLD